MIPRNNFTKTRPFILALFTLITGLMFFFGASFGNMLKGSFLFKRSKLIYLFNYRASDLAKVQSLLVSQNLQQRLAGFYGMIDTETIDVDELILVYQSSELLVIKKASLFVLSHSNKKKAKDFIAHELVNGESHIQSYIRGVLNDGESDVSTTNSRIQF